jgi:retron-type reverse transcriptase
MDLNWMHEAYRRVRKDSAPGIDGQTVAEYGENLTENLRNLLARAKSGRYQAPPVKRAYVPKNEKEDRPIGLPTVRANCTPAQRVFGLGRHHPSVPSAAR